MSERAIKLPDIGEGVTEAELTDWAVAVGDAVREDDTLAVVMTDKAAVEIPSPASGKVVWLGAEAGDTLAVGTVFVRIETDEVAAGDGAGEDAASSQAAPPEAAKSRHKVADGPARQGADPVAPTRDVEATTASSGPRAVAPQTDTPTAAPWVRQQARERGIDLAQVAGSGPGGRILYDDLEHHVSLVAAPGRSAIRQTTVEDVKVTGMRRVIAERMQKAKAEAPHFSIIEEVDVEELERLREALNRSHGAARGKLTVIPFVARAIVVAVAEQPALNAHFLARDGIVRRHGAVHLGIATQTDRGLMVPVVHHAEAMGLWDVAGALRELSKAARDGTIGKPQLEGSTITISSLGALGAVATTPILNLPEVAVVGVNKIAIRPVWNGQGFAPRRLMNLSASFDHRVVDGWDAAVFVARLKALLEAPALMFLE